MDVEGGRLDFDEERFCMVKEGRPASAVQYSGLQHAQYAELAERRSR
jgi:hypothetical protein